MTVVYFVFLKLICAVTADISLCIKMYNLRIFYINAEFPV